MARHIIFSQPNRGERVRWTDYPNPPKAYRCLPKLCTATQASTCSVGSYMVSNQWNSQEATRVCWMCSQVTPNYSSSKENGAYDQLFGLRQRIYPRATIGMLVTLKAKARPNKKLLTLLPFIFLVLFILFLSKGRRSKIMLPDLINIPYIPCAFYTIFV